MYSPYICILKIVLVPLYHAAEIGHDINISITVQVPGAYRKGSGSFLDDVKCEIAAGKVFKPGYTASLNDRYEFTEKVGLDQGSLDLVLTDVVMPKMNGRELYEEICKLHPDVKVIFMSGYTSTVITHRGVIDEGLEFIHKPFTISTLTAKIRDVLDKKKPATDIRAN